MRRQLIVQMPSISKTFTGKIIFFATCEERLVNLLSDLLIV